MFYTMLYILGNFSVYQGDDNRYKGVYHINAIDIATQR